MSSRISSIHSRPRRVRSRARRVRTTAPAVIPSICRYTPSVRYLIIGALVISTVTGLVGYAATLSPSDTVSGPIASSSLVNLPFLFLDTFNSLTTPISLVTTPFDVRDPPPPTDLVVRDPGTGRRLEMSWRVPPGVPVRTFRIYRATGEGNYVRVGEVAAPGSLWIDRRVADGVAYRYTVRSVMEDYEGSRGPVNAGVASDRTPPARPQDIRVQVGTHATRVEILWRNPMDDDFAGVRVYRSAPDQATGVLIADRVISGRYVDDAAPREQPVRYQLTSIDTTGNESRSIQTLPAVGRRDPFHLPRP